MRGAVLSGAAVVLALCWHAQAFDFQADEFDHVFHRAANAHGFFLPTVRLGCEAPTETTRGRCAYAINAVVTLGVVTATGSERPALVYVSWTGEQGGRLHIWQSAEAVAWALSPEAGDGSQTAMSADIRRMLLEFGPAFPERHWSIGHVTYTFRPDPHLGARDAVLFTAVERTE